MSTVKVMAHPTSGNVITPSRNNPEWGTFRVDSENKSMEGGILNISKRSAFIRGKISDLEQLGLRPNQTLAGKIQKQESFSPFYEGQSPKINPSTNEVVLTNGRETYLQYEYTSNPDALDVWVGDTSNEVNAQTEEQLAEQAV